MYCISKMEDFWLGGWAHQNALAGSGDSGTGSGGGEVEREGGEGEEAQ